VHGNGLARPAEESRLAEEWTRLHGQRAGHGTEIGTDKVET